MTKYTGFFSLFGSVTWEGEGTQEEFEEALDEAMFGNDADINGIDYGDIEKGEY